MSKASKDVAFDMILVAIGGNSNSHAGNPHGTVCAAIAMLRAEFSDLMTSNLYETPSFPAGTGPDFVNAACVFRSALPPEDILSILHKIEADFGRVRRQRWGQRTLDLDLIACGGTILPDSAVQTHWRALSLDRQKTETPDTLILPHPRLQDRAFVLVPLADVAPDWVHPMLGQNVTEMLSRLPASDRAGIKAI
jgi:2-amino-4-hydroxy-6-hydroxymethyldihydropteridine diphosphokinase